MDNLVNVQKLNTPVQSHYFDEIKSPFSSIEVNKLKWYTWNEVNDKIPSYVMFGYFLYISHWLKLSFNFVFDQEIENDGNGEEWFEGVLSDS